LKDQYSLPVISLIGRPNVGKSSIFNRLLRRGQRAMTHDRPGVTRDRHYAIASFDQKDLDNSRDIILVDTGGFYPEKSEEKKVLKKGSFEPFFNLMIDHAKATIEESDLVLFVVDVREGLIPFDKAIIDYIRSTRKPFWLLVNKYDTHKQAGEEAQFWELGITEEQLFLVSAEHALGMENLREHIHEFSLGFEASQQQAEMTKGVKPNFDVVASLAIAGVPNVGKSTLLNKLIGDQRALVSNISGTTVDPIEGYIDLYFGKDVDKLEAQEDQFRLSDKRILEILSNEDEEIFDDEMSDENEEDTSDEFEVESQFEETAEEAEEDEHDSGYRSIKLVDTAGIRKSKHVSGYVETQAVYSSLRAIGEADIILYLVDATEGITHQDRRLMDIALEKGKSIVICLNKIDLLNEIMQDSRKRKEWMLDLEDRIPWLRFCNLVTISAKKGSHLNKLKREVKKTIFVRNQKISTSKLNACMSHLVEKNPITAPSSRGAKFKIKYASMIKSCPPTMLLVCNKSKELPETFKRYLKNGVREAFNFSNTPIHLIFRTSSELKERAKRN